MKKLTGVIPNVDINIHNGFNKPMDWIDNQFESVSEIFPNWLTSEIMLREFIVKTGDFIIRTNSIDKSNIEVGLAFPLVQTIEGKMVPMLETFPPEEREKVESISGEVLSDYIIELDKFLSQRVTEQTLHSMASHIKSWWKEIECEHGRNIKQELGFRLGLSPLAVELFEPEIVVRL